MIVKNLNTNQLSQPAYQKYLDYLEVLDSKIIETYSHFLSDDIAIQFGNSKPISGKKKVVETLTNYWKSFAEIEHDLTNIYGTDSKYVLEAKNHYLRHDGNKVTVHAVAFTDLDADGLVKSIRIYGDTSPVFADM